MGSGKRNAYREWCDSQSENRQNVMVLITYDRIEDADQVLG